MANKHVERLLEVLRTFPQAAVQDAIPWMVLVDGGLQRGSPPALVDRMSAFADKVGLMSTMTQAERQARVDKYFADNPVHPGLVAALQGVSREWAVERQGDGPSTAVKNLLGTPSSATPRSGAPPPAGAVKAGPMARMGANQKVAGKRKK